MWVQATARPTNHTTIPSLTTIWAKPGLLSIFIATSRIRLLSKLASLPTYNSLIKIHSWLILMRIGCEWWSLKVEDFSCCDILSINSLILRIYMLLIVSAFITAMSSQISYKYAFGYISRYSHTIPSTWTEFPKPSYALHQHCTAVALYLSRVGKNVKSAQQMRGILLAPHTDHIIYHINVQ